MSAEDMRGLLSAIATAAAALGGLWALLRILESLVN